MKLTLQKTLENAKKLHEAFQKMTQETQDLFRGVQISEVFFIYATLGQNFQATQNKPLQQIIESGRALGQSTSLLAKIYPNMPIISVERDPNHKDAPVAVQRLKKYPNIACLFGDSRILLPQLTLPGDAIVIDGPKELRALKLAIEMAQKKQPIAIFIHDCYKGSLIRKFMEKNVPHAFYSDHPQFVSQYAHLDHHQPKAFLNQWTDAENFPTEQSYAGTFGCIPQASGFPSTALKAKRTFARIKENILKTLGVSSVTNTPAS